VAQTKLLSSVADSGSLPRILIYIHPGSRIPDPTTAPKEKGEKIAVLPFYVATNITKFKLFIFEVAKIERKTLTPTALCFVTSL
jgi:hypothetical protein